MRSRSTWKQSKAAEPVQDTWARVPNDGRSRSEWWPTRLEGQWFPSDKKAMEGMEDKKAEVDQVSRGQNVTVKSACQDYLAYLAVAS